MPDNARPAGAKKVILLSTVENHRLEAQAAELCQWDNSMALSFCMADEKDQYAMQRPCCEQYKFSKRMA